MQAPLGGWGRLGGEGHGAPRDEDRRFVIVVAIIVRMVVTAKLQFLFEAILNTVSFFEYLFVTYYTACFRYISLSFFTVPQRGIRKGESGNKVIFMWLKCDLNIIFRCFFGWIPLFGPPFPLTIFIVMRLSPMRFCFHCHDRHEQPPHHDVARSDPSR